MPFDTPMTPYHLSMTFLFSFLFLVPRQGLGNILIVALFSTETFLSVYLYSSVSIGELLALCLVSVTKQIYAIQCEQARYANEALAKLQNQLLCTQ